MKRWLFYFLVVLGVGLLGATAVPLYACGGLFCQNSPVDQNAERIIFTQNHDGTISALIQIQYTGFDDDFSWILPIPEAISADDIAVPEGAREAFQELEIATNPIFIPPSTPFCARDFSFNFGLGGSMAYAPVEEQSAVNVFASGEVGPYGFDVIGSDDQNALVSWLKEHNYVVTAEMEPLINVYIQEKFYFLAMRLLPKQGVQDIQPIQLTYHSAKPMIPLRLTAVAATADMAVLVWFFGDNQAIPVNYAHMEVPDRELTFYAYGGNNYRQLMASTADQFNGRAFVTEYAGPTNTLAFNNVYLKATASKYPYLTRLNTVLSPNEMLVDPTFDYDAQLANVSNIHDLSQASGLYDCERARSAPVRLSPDEKITAAPGFWAGFYWGVGGVVGSLAVLGLGIWYGRRRRQS